MALETGTATDYDDLLDKLKSFLTTNAALVALNQQWTVKADVTPDDRYLYLMGPGLAGNDEIYVNIRRFYYAATGAYNWGLRGATGYNAGSDFDTQAGTNDNPCYLCLANTSITYWFIANGRRFIVIAKIGTVFTSCYCGLILPYALPSEYPYPLFIGATSYLNSQLYTDTGQATTAFWKPGYTTAVPNSGKQLRLVSGYWLNFTQNAPSNPASYRGKIWPYWSRVSFTDPGIGDWTKNADGSYTNSGIILYSDTYDTKDVFGELDGVYHIPGTDLNSEDTINVNGEVFLAIQNIEKVGRNDFAGIFINEGIRDTFIDALLNASDLTKTTGLDAILIT